MQQIYKVFLNERLIEIGSLVNITLNIPTVNFNHGCKVEDIQNWFNYFKNNEINHIFLVHPDPEKFFQLFKSAFLIIEAAGGLVVNAGHILVIYRNGKWDLPKGKIDKGERSKDAALREVSEECGILGHSIVKSLPSTFHIYRSPYPGTKGQWIFKETFWFEMRYNGIMTGIPQQEEGITEIKWVPKTEIYDIMGNTYGNIKLIIDFFIGHQSLCQ